MSTESNYDKIKAAIGGNGMKPNGGDPICFTYPVKYPVPGDVVIELIPYVIGKSDAPQSDAPQSDDPESDDPESDDPETDAAEVLRFLGHCYQGISGWHCFKVEKIVGDVTEASNLPPSRPRLIPGRQNCVQRWP